jgi:hypothetical protein
MDQRRWPRLAICRAKSDFYSVSNDMRAVNRVSSDVLLRRPKLLQEAHVAICLVRLLEIMSAFAALKLAGLNARQGARASFLALP